MLERLDTLIAFATVLLGVSLLITILNQMINALLGHRGTYLKDGLKDLLETLDPIERHRTEQSPLLRIRRAMIDFLVPGKVLRSLLGLRPLSDQRIRDE